MRQSYSVIPPSNCLGLWDVALCVCLCLCVCVFSVSVSPCLCLCLFLDICVSVSLRLCVAASVCGYGCVPPAEKVVEAGDGGTVTRHEQQGTTLLARTAVNRSDRGGACRTVVRTSCLHVVALQAPVHRHRFCCGALACASAVEHATTHTHNTHRQTHKWRCTRMSACYRETRST